MAVTGPGARATVSNRRQEGTTPPRFRVTSGGPG